MTGFIYFFLSIHHPNISNRKKINHLTLSSMDCLKHYWDMKSVLFEMQCPLLSIENQTFTLELSEVVHDHRHQKRGEWDLNVQHEFMKNR